MAVQTALEFPVLRVAADGFAAQGGFAEQQARFLTPDAAAVDALRTRLRRTEVGVVAHFYMDPQLQGVLCATGLPHIHVADSLQMAGRAVAMVRAGAKAIVVLGVDFMAENVRAMLDAEGFAAVPVYRVAQAPIGCTLAEAAEAPAYLDFLRAAATEPQALHVIYINTSLQVKAVAERLLPTVTCTSSNVLSLILQAFAELPDLQIFFGPDSLMGANLHSYLDALAAGPAAHIHALHPAHDAASLLRLRERLHVFSAGHCAVHQMFDEDVVDSLKLRHADDHLTAHLEVPGAMFHLALEAQARGRGVVGSTSQILAFITERLDALCAEERQTVPRFVLGTEAGMVTAIVRAVQMRLRAQAGKSGPSAVDIVFPVAMQAVHRDASGALPLMPGVSQGEGCSAAGGCATCPYMKMNSLEALLDVLTLVAQDSKAALRAYAPPPARALDGGEAMDATTCTALGRQPILHMQSFQAHGVLPDALRQRIVSGA